MMLSSRYLHVVVNLSIDCRIGLFALGLTNHFRCFDRRFCQALSEANYVCTGAVLAVTNLLTRGGAGGREQM
jgi:hypothetical protein